MHHVQVRGRWTIGHLNGRCRSRSRQSLVGVDKGARTAPGDMQDPTVPVRRRFNKCGSCGGDGNEAIARYRKGEVRAMALWKADPTVCYP